MTRKNHDYKSFEICRVIEDEFCVIEGNIWYFENFWVFNVFFMSEVIRVRLIWLFHQQYNKTECVWLCALSLWLSQTRKWLKLSNDLLDWKTIYLNVTLVEWVIVIKKTVLLIIIVGLSNNLSDTAIKVALVTVPEATSASYLSIAGMHYFTFVYLE